MRRLLGEVPDLDLRADLSTAWVIFNGLVLGRSVSTEEVERLVRLLEETASSGTRKRRAQAKAKPHRSRGDRSKRGSF